MVKSNGGDKKPESRHVKTPTHDCSDPIQAMLYARTVLYRTYSYLGLTLGASIEARECEYAIQCLDRALNEAVSREDARG